MFVSGCVSIRPGLSYGQRQGTNARIRTHTDDVNLESLSLLGKQRGVLQVGVEEGVNEGCFPESRGAHEEYGVVDDFAGDDLVVLVGQIRNPNDAPLCHAALRRCNSCNKNASSFSQGKDPTECFKYFNQKNSIQICKQYIYDK